MAGGTLHAERPARIAGDETNSRRPFLALRTDFARKGG